MDLLLKIANMCRICENESNYIDLSHPNHQCYVDKFLSCANVTFEIHDKLPKNLCEICKIDLENAYNFKVKCEKSHRKLKQLFKSTAVKNDEDLSPKVELNDKEFDGISFNATNSNLECIDVNEFDLNLKTEIIEEDEISLNTDDNVDNHFNSSPVPVTITRQIIKRKNYNLKTKSSVEQPQFICDICNRKYMAKFFLEQHMQNKHKMVKNLYECQYCGKYISGKHISTHIYIHEKPFQCEICSMKFSVKRNLFRHIKNIHENPKVRRKPEKKKTTKVKVEIPRNFKCTDCDMAFVKKSQLDQHKLSKEYGFNCDKCCKSYKYTQALEQHKLTHLSIGERKLYELKHPKLRRKDRKSKNEKLPKLIKEKTKPTKQSITRVCQICGKIYTSATNFWHHMSTHSDSKPFKCKFCNKLFKRSTQCREHERMHTGEKPYKCNMCSMSFRQFPHLTRHKRTHTGEKPFKCDFCDKTFAQTANRKKHMRVHTGEKPYQCKLCAENFTELSSLKKHIIKQHDHE